MIHPISAPFRMLAVCLLASGVMLGAYCPECAATPEPPAFWRSALFPMDWTPAHEDTEGRFLHDFSYAGYHNGEVALPATPPGTVFNAVTGYGADDTGATDATTAIQATIDAAAGAGGGIVYLPEGLYRCDGTLSVTHSGTVIRGDGQGLTRVYFTKSANMSDKAHLAYAASITEGTDLPLAEDGVNRSTVVRLSDATSLQPGDDIAVGWTITADFIAEHGMTGTWTVFLDQWKPVFLRTVVAVDTSVSPHQVTLDVPLRYPAKLRDGASVRELSGYLTECGIERLSIATAVDWDDAWQAFRTHAISMSGAKDSWMRDVNTFISPADPENEYHLQGGGVRILSSKRMTIADCCLEKVQNNGDGGCGYLFHLTKSNEILVRDCTGNAGRHNFIQNWDFGTAGCVFLRCTSTNGRADNGLVTVIGFCEYHHSLAMACLVDDCTLDDGWYGGNRGLESSGAGHTTTQNAYWHTGGNGQLRSWAYDWGYVIGTEDISVQVGLVGFTWDAGTEPVDFTEGVGDGDGLLPRSLYEDQLARRLGHPDSDGDGLSDADETSGAHGPSTDPADPDMDGDGITDGDEVLGTLGAVTNPEEDDTDGDGLTDFEEFAYETDPTDPKDTPLCSLSVPFFQEVR